MVTTPKGTRIIAGDTARSRKNLQNTIEQILQTNTFEPISAPSIDLTKRYIEKSGPDIREELYELQTEEELCLTPEITPLIAQYAADTSQQYSKPIKWYSTQKMWRYEQVQQGRFREFLQTNVDIYGQQAPDAEITLIQTIIQLFESLNINPSEVTIQISDREILPEFIQTYTNDITTKEKFDIIRTIDKSEKLTQEEYLTQLSESGVDDPENFITQLQKPLSELQEELDIDSENLQQVLNTLSTVYDSDWVEFSPELARGLDYYDGIVFEAFADTTSMNRSLLGGGRYDSLLKYYGDEELDGVGFAFGYEPLLVFLEELNKTPISTQESVFIARFDKTSELTDEIRRILQKENIPTEVGTRGDSIGSQFSQADDQDYTYVILVGPEEQQNNIITIQNLETGNEQQANLESILQKETIPIDQLS